MRKYLLAFCTVISIFFATSVEAQEWEKIASALPAKYDHYYEYEYSVAIDGNYAVVGASDCADYKGIAYVLYYDGTNWEIQAKLRASIRLENHRFGGSVSISGNYIVVGAQGYTGGRGAVFIFEKPESGWEDMTESIKITSPDYFNTEYFGRNVAIVNDYVAISGKQNYEFCVYVFTKSISGWENGNAALLTTSGYNDCGTLGFSGDQLIIGAVESREGGAAYVFEKPESGWINSLETAKLTPSDTTTWSRFGSSVDIAEGIAVVGAEIDDFHINNTGSAYVFVKPEGGWRDANETAKLTASDGAEADYFGCSVEISGEQIVVGASDNDSYGFDNGAAYIFKKPSGGWVDNIENEKISTPNSYSYLSDAADISGDFMILSAAGRDSVYLYNYSPKSIVQNLCEGKVFKYALKNPEVGSTFRWQENTGSSWIDIAGEANDTLVIPNVTLGMGGFQYRCIISGTSYDTTDVATLHVNPIYNETETGSVCIGDSYIFPDGTTQNNITSQVIQVSNLQTVYGCDSIIETTVNVNPVYNLSETVTIKSGENYTFPDGTIQENITSQVIYTSNLQTIYGCDSIIETTVNVEQIQDCIFTEEVSVCSGSDYLFPDGTLQSNITSQVVHESYLPSIYGCDTIIETTVNVNQGDVTYLYETICKGETFQLDYAILSSPGVYGVTLTNQFGCDSLVSLDLEVIELDVDLGRDKTIGVNDTVILDAGENFETYYWSTEEISQTILVDSSYGVGSHTFNVIVTDENDCSATDDITITISEITGINFNDKLDDDIKLYPNPTSGKINIDLTEINEPIEISIFDIAGKTLMHKELNSNDSSFELEIPGYSGVYFIKLSSGLNSKTYKIIKE